ncbi:zinc finger protein 665 isoform X1 [Drosophila sulfurigaster albostrigata]|uniref:zinc finger protein 665 isoform X1 n=1 Tax=Drosophila sulfurigaster albostrigata TaxID=89887 RepID=UPI002D219FCB|nr:zinc finger protein 665 isoform X1 [Drosophila sulfurigaster albostrigata]
MNSAGPICRICLQQPKTETLMPTDENFCSNIKQCTGVMFTQEVEMPNKICTSCALLLRAALRLRTLCQQAEEQFRHLKLEPQQPQEQQMKLDSDSESDVALSEIEGGVSYELTLETESITHTETTVPETKSERHQPEENKGINYVCNICNNVYSEKVKLTAHLKLHSVHKPHECEICHKRFRQTPQLARHMNSHTGLRPYKCDYCESSFADPSTRIKHQRIHTKERPYKCKYCTKSFAYSNVLNVHLKIHTGERPFSCQYCGRRFSQLHHKNTHERSHRAKDSDSIMITLEEE